MALNVDFLTKEIFIKIITKGLSVFRTLFLLYFFAISDTLDNFYFSKSIIGVVILLNILIEITYSQKLNLHKENFNFIKKFALVLNKASAVLGILLIALTLLISKNREVTIHIMMLSLWAILNINSNFFLLLYRYKEYNFNVLSYYLLVSVFDILFLLISLYTFNEAYIFIGVSLSLCVSELLVFLLIFYKFFALSFKKGNSKSFQLDLERTTLHKVFLILVIISLIDISDKFFLSFLGEGKITYYTYGLYAPLMIRQSLDIRSNFFVQINVAENFEQIKIIFFKTIKKLVPFFLLGVLFLIVATEVMEEFISNVFKIKDISFFKNIIYLGVLITPFYMIWDLFYRFYYREKKINYLLRIVSVGLLINILFNYIFGISLSWGLYGILISTLSVFAFYNYLSFRYFFVKK